MHRCNLRAVAKQGRNKWGWDLSHKVMEGGVAGAEQVDAECAETVHERVAIEVASYAPAGSQAWRVGREVKPVVRWMCRRRSEDEA